MAEDESPRYFTVQEANEALSMIRPLVEQIMAIRQKILENRPAVWPVVAKAAGNGGSREASLMEQDFKRLDGLVRQVRATGAVMKDINQGLVDFLSLRDGHEVYLCWQVGEAQILYWHELDEGFAGRQTI